MLLFSSASKKLKTLKDRQEVNGSATTSPSSLFEAVLMFLIVSVVLSVSDKALITRVRQFCERILC